MIDLSKLHPVLQTRVAQVTNEAALEAPAIAREVSRQGRERAEKENRKLKRLKETRKETMGQVHSQSEPSEEGPYQGRDPRRRKLPGF